MSLSSRSGDFLRRRFAFVADLCSLRPSGFLAITFLRASRPRRDPEQSA
jgi:hypothetical protein